MDENNNKNQNGEELDVELDSQDGAEGTGADNNDNDDKGSKGSGNNNGATEKSFTQSQVTRMMTREKNQGRNAAFKELGIDPKDSKMVNMVKAMIESQKTDEQKAAEQKSAEQAALEEANHKAAVAEAKAEAMMLGIKKNFVDDAVTLAMSKMTDDSDLKTIIGELKTKYPIWFEDGGDDNDDGKGQNKDKTGQRGTGSSVKSVEKDKKGGEDNKGLGARLAAQRNKGAGKKSSYWG